MLLLLLFKEKEPRYSPAHASYFTSLDMRIPKRATKQVVFMTATMFDKSPLDHAYAGVCC
jgi:hypothetical protein